MHGRRPRAGSPDESAKRRLAALTTPSRFTPTAVAAVVPLTPRAAIPSEATLATHLPSDRLRAWWPNRRRLRDRLEVPTAPGLPVYLSGLEAHGDGALVLRRWLRDPLLSERPDELVVADLLGMLRDLFLLAGRVLSGPCALAVRIEPDGEPLTVDGLCYFDGLPSALGPFESHRTGDSASLAAPEPHLADLLRALFATAGRVACSLVDGRRLVPELRARVESRWGPIRQAPSASP